MDRDANYVAVGSFVVVVLAMATVFVLWYSNARERREYVRYEVYCMVAYHQDFQGRYYYEHLGMDPTLREQHRHESWYALAETFADEWDQKSFDPQFASRPLEHFEPMVRRVFARAKSI